MEFLTDIAVILGAAFVGGMLARRLGQPPVVGYLMAGVALGLAGQPLISSAENVDTAAEWGVALLMFAVGVEFSLKSLAYVRKIAIWGGLSEVIFTMALGATVAVLFGRDLYTAIFIGCIVSVSSTMIILKLLDDKGEVDTSHGRIMLGILIVEDLAVIVMVALLPVFGRATQTDISEVMLTLAIAGAYLIVAMLLASRIIPAALARVAKTRSRELFVLTVVAICLSAAVGTYHIGLSLALGAFVAGLIVSESEYSHSVLAEILPLRDLFSAVFFVSIGLLLRPEFLSANWLLALSLLGVILVGKPLIITVIALVFRVHGKVAVTVGLGLAQIGEFSFVLAQVGVQRNLVGGDVYALTIISAVAAALISPSLLNAAPTVYNACLRLAPLRNLLTRGELEVESPHIQLRDHTIICGFGRVGAYVGAALAEHGAPYVVIDYDFNTVHRLRAKGIPAIYGDASNPRVLDFANPELAGMAVIAIPDSTGAAVAVRHLKEMNPSIIIVARAHTDIDLGRMYAEGAEEVIQAEFEAGLEMIRHSLYRLGVPLQRAQAYVDEIRASRYHFPEIVAPGGELPPTEPDTDQRA